MEVIAKHIGRKHGFQINGTGPFRHGVDLVLWDRAVQNLANTRESNHNPFFDIDRLANRFQFQMQTENHTLLTDRCLDLGDVALG
jgi:hypothetical protein